MSVITLMAPLLIKSILGPSQCKIISAHKEPRHLATLKPVGLI